MPLTTTFAALSSRGYNGSSIAGAVSYFLYMYSGTAFTGYMSENDIALGSYDTSISKYTMINAYNDQFLVIDNSSNITLNETSLFTYGDYLVAGNNYAIASITGSGSPTTLRNISALNYKDLGGTLMNTPQQPNFAYDSSGNIIMVATITGYMSVSKFTNTGTIVWQRRFTLPNTTGKYFPNYVSLDTSGNIYTAGQYVSSGVTPGTTALWAKITSAGAISYMKYTATMLVTGLKVIGSSMYMTMIPNPSSPALYKYYYTQVSTTDTPYVVIADTSTGSITKVSQIAQSPNNSYALCNIEINASDPNSVFVYGYSRTYTSVPTTKVVIFKLDSTLTTMLSQRELSFTSNTVVNPTYTACTTYISNITYLPSFNTYWISGIIQDMATSLNSSTPTYLSGYFLRAQVDQDYTGTILNRTYNIQALADTISVNNITPFAVTTFASTGSNTSYTLTVSTPSATAGSTTPTKVNL